MALDVSKQDESYRAFALNASPLRVIFTTCGPLALYQALQSIFKILDALMASSIGSEAVSAEPDHPDDHCSWHGPGCGRQYQDFRGLRPGGL